MILNKALKIFSITILSLMALIAMPGVISLVKQQPEGKVCAQDALLVQGQACEQQFAECPSGYINFLEAYNSNVIQTYGFEKRQLLDNVRNTFQSDPNRLCIPRGSTSFIRFLRSNAASQGSFLYEGVVGGPFRSYVYYSACPDGTRPSQGINTLSQIVDTAFTSYSRPYACCPNGFTFVNETNGAAEHEYQSGACCRGTSSQFGRFNGVNGGGCLDSQDNIVHRMDNSYDVSSNPNIIGFVGFRPSEEIEADNAPGEYPIYGTATKGSFFAEGSLPGSDQGCPAGATCAVRRGAGETVGFGRQIANREGEPTSSYVVPAASFQNTEDLQCTRCFVDGEAIAVENDTVLICDASEPTLVAVRPLVDNSVNSTLAAYREDPVNRDLLISCVEKGGIYVAIGCVDPTPLGVLTGLIRIAFGITGGVALILLILAGIAYQSGDEARIEEAKKRVFGVIGGLAVLVFSVLILRIVGVNILDVVPQGAF